jgi:hypothetical protein
MNERASLFVTDPPHLLLLLCSASPQTFAYCCHKVLAIVQTIRSTKLAQLLKHIQRAWLEADAEAAVRHSITEGSCEVYI